MTTEFLPFDKYYDMTTIFLNRHSNSRMHVKYVGLHTSIHLHLCTCAEYVSNLHKHLSDRNPEHFISLIFHHAEKFNTNSLHLLVPGADIQYMIFYSKNNCSKSHGTNPAAAAT